MVRRKEDASTYEEFSSRLAGAKDADRFELVDEQGNPLSRPEQREVAKQYGAVAIEQQGGVPVIVMRPPTYGSLFEARQSDVTLAINSLRRR